MRDARHLELDAVKLLAAGCALLCEVVQLQELLLQLQGSGKERAPILWLEHELVVVVHIQGNAHARGVHFHHNAVDSIGGIAHWIGPEFLRGCVMRRLCH